MRAFGGAGLLVWFCAEGFGLGGISKAGDCPELPTECDRRTVTSCLECNVNRLGGVGVVEMSTRRET